MAILENGSFDKEVLRRLLVTKFIGKMESLKNKEGQKVGIWKTKSHEEERSSVIWMPIYMKSSLILKR